MKLYITHYNPLAEEMGKLDKFLKDESGYYIEFDAKKDSLQDLSFIVTNLNDAESHRFMVEKEGDKWNLVLVD